MLKRLFCFLIVGVIFLSTQTLASVKAEGTFIADHACDAFVSFRKQTNPDDASVQAGQRYRLLEKNKPVATWYRIILDSASPKARWVEVACGQVDRADVKDASSCQIAGQQDSYKLALSWHPAFCEKKPNKAECRINDKSVYHAGNFTLHGLWPNKVGCGKTYGFCADVKQVRRPFCHYPKLKLDAEVRSRLNQIMPSAGAGTCLQRHEWFKHGSCQMQWDVNGYYEQSIRLTEAFNQSGIAAWMQKNIGEKVKTAAFMQQVDKALGAGASQRLQLKCSKGNLTDVYISLPKHLPKDELLSELMRRAKPDFHNRCGKTFRVDTIGVGR